MQDWPFDQLPDYAFPRLRELLAGVPAGGKERNLSIGEPKHAFPSFVADILKTNLDGYGSYPPNEGTAEWRTAVHAWLARRYGIDVGRCRTQIGLEPVNGTREGLYSIAQAVTPRTRNGRTPIILLPNPFYQCYVAACLAARAEPYFVPAGPDSGFLPDFASVPEPVLARSCALYVCSPANPQGAVADEAYWQALIELSRAYDIALIVDECYSEIYDKTPPPGILAAVFARPDAEIEDCLSRIVTLNSLSKRSNLPGLRSGFAAGGRPILDRFALLRRYGGAPSPLPVYAAAAAAWSDEHHVIANRALYRQKIDLAERIFGSNLGFYRPPGGFFLWLNVGTAGETGESAALRLWREGGIRVLPGAYLARTVDGENPGASYIRVALVHDLPFLQKTLTRVNQILR